VRAASFKRRSGGLLAPSRQAGFYCRGVTPDGFLSLAAEGLANGLLPIPAALP
jgi:hypothetical protein